MVFPFALKSVRHDSTVRKPSASWAAQGGGALISDKIGHYPQEASLESDVISGINESCGCWVWRGRSTALGQSQSAFSARPLRLRRREKNVKRDHYECPKGTGRRCCHDLEDLFHRRRSRCSGVSRDRHPRTGRPLQL